MRLFFILHLIFMWGCSSYSVIELSSRYKDERIKYLVIHFTSENFERSLEILTGKTESMVSVHYLVPEPGDPSYLNNNINVYSLVTEEKRAWHAGISHWGGVSALNGTSIGIEIVNRSTCLNLQQEILEEEHLFPRRDCNFYVFPEEQIDTVILLIKDILSRNPGIEPINVVGHGDIAINRRVDPGPLFPWEQLYKNGIGAWYESEAVAEFKDILSVHPVQIEVIQKALKAYGYDVVVTGSKDAQTELAIQAFQMHFRASDYSGIIDNETVSILFALLDKYHPKKFNQIFKIKN